MPVGIQGLELVLQTDLHEPALALIKQRRFGPFFYTQFLGAFNDNVFKNALIIFIAFFNTRISASSDDLINLAQALFILPYFIFSAFAGQLADKYEKSHYIRWVKLGEVVLMSLAALAFCYHNINFLLLLLFGMGVQATFFGPVKYSILPQQLAKHELVKGNALVESSTFVAILFGTIFGGILIAQSKFGELGLGIAIILLSLAGFFTSFFIPRSSANDPDLKINWNIFPEIVTVFRMAAQDRVVFLSLLGISWFWFYGAIILSQLPNYAKIYLGGNETVVTLLLSCFAIGIGIGALWCNRMSRDRVEIGLVPLGSLGLSLFAFGIYFVTPAHVHWYNASISQVFGSGHVWMVLLNALLLGIFGGFYSVPLYVTLQARSKPEVRSRIISANNILNALFVVCASLLAIGLIALGMSLPAIFFSLGLMNFVVTVILYFNGPEFIWRFIAWLLVHTLYRVEVVNMHHIPKRGPAVLICNHVSYMDPVVVFGTCPRRVRFVMDYKIHNYPIMRFFFKQARTIPIATQKENPEIKRQAFIAVAKTLSVNQLVGIFPEGRITPDGEIGPFRPGIEQVIKTSPVPVIPMAVQGLWDSYFSFQKGRWLARFPKQFRAHVRLVIGEPIPPEKVTAKYLQEVVMHLRGDLR